ncbi:MAG: type I phosphoribosyltransferase [Minisyncoccota bacterium]
MKKSYPDLKTKAIELRKTGLSYGSISKELKIAKSTTSLWLRNIEITSNQKKILLSNRTIHLNTGPHSQKNRRLREVNTIIEKAKTEVSDEIDLESYRLFGAALYWAEGSKKQMLNMTNSDPRLILFWVKWLNKIFKIPPTGLKVWLNIYPQQNEKDLKNFWSELTGIPLKNFGKSYTKPFSKNYKTNNLYYGTARVTAFKSTNYRHQVFGWTQAVLKDIIPKVNAVQEKWQKLKVVARPTNLK